MKKNILIMTAFLAGAGLGAQKVEKRCTISGTWTSQTKKKGKSNWKVKVTWNNGEGNSAYGFSIKNDGPHKDQFGTYTLEGGCSEGFCDFHQNYQTGKFKGRYYSYSGGYTELKPLKLSGNYGLVEGERLATEGTYTLDKMTCGK